MVSCCGNKHKKVYTNDKETKDQIETRLGIQLRLQQHEIT